MTALQKDTTDSDFTFALCVASLDHPFHAHPSGTDCRVEEIGRCTQACWTGEGRWDDNVCKNITLLNQTSNMKGKTQENQQRKHTCLSLLLSQMVDEFFQLEKKIFEQSQQKMAIISSTNIFQLEDATNEKGSLLSTYHCVCDIDFSLCAECWPKNKE